MKDSYKQVIVLRKDLNMRKGKMIAQGAHASITAYLQAVSSEGEASRAAKRWFKEGQTKICVGVNSEEELDLLYQRAKEAGVTASLIVDSGRTEFKGKPTKTAVAIGPNKVGKIDAITSHLKLL